MGIYEVLANAGIQVNWPLLWETCLINSLSSIGLHLRNSPSKGANIILDAPPVNFMS